MERMYDTYLTFFLVAAVVFLTLADLEEDLLGKTSYRQSWVNSYVEQLTAKSLAPSLGKGWLPFCCLILWVGPW
jgi:hypothetical protein